MPLASMRSNNLGGSAAGPTKSLYIDGLDVLKQPGTSTNRYGVPIETCSVTEAGPGGISGMSFTLEDPSISLPPPQPGQWVRFQDHTNDRPIFLGFLQSFSPQVFGLGVLYEVEAIGIETVLDWQVIASDTTFAVGINTADAVQTLYAAAAGIGVPLRTARAGSSQGSSQAAPIGSIDPAAITSFGKLANAVTVTAGTTLREGIRQLTDQNIASSDTLRVGGTANPNVSVDFYSGLRVWLGTLGTEYAVLTVNDAVAGPLIAAGLQHETDATGIVPQVYVKGGNAAGSGIVSAGSGLPGPIATLNDSTITTAADRDAKGYAYLSDKGSGVRGTFVLESYDPAPNVRAGSRLLITDAQLGLSSYFAPVMQIGRKFLSSGKEDWTITYGGLRASFATAVRRLTRDITS